MVTRFGSREICDVTFKSLTDQTFFGHDFKAGQPVFVIDTATASSMEQASTTVYAQGGRGYNRLVAWEGEKTMTFNVTDALMSPLGLAVLTGAKGSDATDKEVKHIHVTYDISVDGSGNGKILLKDLAAELGVIDSKKADIKLCDDENIKPYATVLDSNGAIIDWVNEVSLTQAAAGDDIVVVATDVESKTIKVDFYVYMSTGITQITIGPDDFGGFFYVEADTLYRNQNGTDMAATLTFPKVKVQSGFTISMSPTGDPSTFDFVMDAMPAYTFFDHTKKVVCDITIVGGSESSDELPKHDEKNHSKN